MDYSAVANLVKSLAEVSVCTDAFKKTIETFKNIDILINNAGILNDSTWQKEIAINLNGTINGVLLGLENYLPKYKSGSEAVIVNLSSIAGVNAFACIPVYTATKFAVHGLTVAWGDPVHFNATKVRVVGVCPGVTLTPLITEPTNKCLGPRYEEYKNIELDIPLQEPAQVAPRVMEVIQKAENGTMWVIEGGQPPYQYKIENRFEVPKIPLQ